VWRQHHIFSARTRAAGSAFLRAYGHAAVQTKCPSINRSHTKPAVPRSQSRNFAPRIVSVGASFTNYSQKPAVRG
jgi:hypothetical protein